MDFDVLFNVVAFICAFVIIWARRQCCERNLCFLSGAEGCLLGVLNFSRPSNLPFYSRRHEKPQYRWQVSTGGIAVITLHSLFSLFAILSICFLH